MEWEIIAAVAALATIIGGVIARDRYVMKQISSGDEAVRDAAQKASDMLHERVNRTRDEYVRRVDLDSHLTRLDTSMQDLAKEMRDSARNTSQRLDAVLAHLMKKD